MVAIHVVAVLALGLKVKIQNYAFLAISYTVSVGIIVYTSFLNERNFFQKSRSQLYFPLKKLRFPSDDITPSLKYNKKMYLPILKRPHDYKRPYRQFINSQYP